MVIPKGTKLHCSKCGKVVTEFIRDLSDSEEIRNSHQYLKIVPIKCKFCGKTQDLYRLIMEELGAKKT